MEPGGSIGKVGAIFMIGKRYINQEVAFSVVGHGCLLLFLIFVGSGGVPSVPPQAMTVELVPASEAPQIEQNVDGTPLESTSNGSELSSDADKGSASTARPDPKSALPSLQQAQAPSKAKRKGSAEVAKPQVAKAEQPETQPQAAEPLLPPTAPTEKPQPHPKEAADQPNAGEMFALPLAMPGGQVAGGVEAPAPNPAMLAHDDTAAFRAHLSSCSKLPDGIDQSAAIALRIFFKRDGTLASEPKLLNATLSVDAATLLQTAVSALQRCQPFTELPADRYRKWKTLDIVVTPLALSGG
jgi:hypothetical protein